MSYTVVGTCSLCGGMVTVPTVWSAVIPATPTCQQCGAVAAIHGPVIPMQPNNVKITYSSGTGIPKVETISGDSGKTLLVG